ncbi:MAG: putative monovalent cation/H+ antiporter subunit A [Kiloniellales bacterium]|nr:putative monovalent cation/H+ antiporter subunit A [Kiloniellales bacterium]
MRLPGSGEEQEISASGRDARAAWGGLLLAALPAGLASLFAIQIPAVAGGEVLRLSADWVPSLGVSLAFLLDGLSLTFALLITGIGSVVLLYSGAYLGGHPHLGRYYLYLLSFMVAMLGLVLADNLITLFVFWELTTITSYLLVGFDHGAAKSRRAALQALLVTGAGGLALLAGLILLGTAAGSFEISQIVASGALLREHALYLPILVLVLLGAFTKSAQVPFHFWLPNAMAAPTPVSAYLHSATMVKAGIYLLARLHPALSGTEAWIWSLTVFGAVTAVWASVLALRQTDLKLVLAYTTVMALGTLTMFLGAEATVAVAAAMTFLIVHAFYKAALFLVVGMVDHASGTREVQRLRGLARAMPLTAAAAALAALSMAGFPPFLGFIGKELKYEGALAIASEPLLVASAAVLANALMVAAAAIVALRPFYGPPAATPKPPQEAPVQMWIGPLLLATLGLSFGLAPSLIADVFVQPAVTAILGRPETVKLALWHGINLPLMLSLLTFALGIAVYAVHRRVRAALFAAEARLPVTADRGWDRLLDGLKAVAAVQTRVLQSGRLTSYLLVVFVTLTLALGGSLLLTDALRLPEALPRLLPREWGLLALVAVGAVLAAGTRSRLAAICALGVVGVGIALLFVSFGAPDLAITQLLVETLVVVLLAVLMVRLPGFGAIREAATWRRRRDALVALGLGAAVAAVLLAVVATPLDRELTAYFESTSLPEAFGRNIVNVILVDFRALDTFGEIAVVVVAALAAFALLRGAAGREAPR